MRSILCIIVITYLGSSTGYGLQKYRHEPLSVDTAAYPIQSLAQVNWGLYVNRSISSMLHDVDELFPGFILGRIIPKGRPSIGNAINIYFANDIALTLTVENFQFMNPVSQDRSTWDLSLFKRENISQIELWNRDVKVYNSRP